MDLSRSSEKLLYDVAEAVAYEVRAQWNNATRTSTHYPDAGLSCFSPVINIMRHPLWGRNQVSSRCHSLGDLSVYSSGIAVTGGANKAVH